MASMTAKAYLTKVNEICVFEAKAGRCIEAKGGRGDCPLWSFNCGLPINPKNNDAVIELVKNYKIIEQGKCSGCGRDVAELIDKQDIKFCPYCGQSIRAEKNNN